MGNKARVDIATAEDIVTARQKGRLMAAELGFSASEATVIAAAIREVTRNILDFADHGEVCLDRIERGPRQGLQIVARDHGPGIANIDQALQYGYSTRNSLGAGLPAARWLMDEFEILSSPAAGTTVTMRKWVHCLATPSHAT